MMELALIGSVDMKSLLRRGIVSVDCFACH